MDYRKIGETVTDENGRAVINYTGTGAGLVELIAETTIDGSIIQSEIYLIDDTEFYDLGTDSTHSMFATSSTMTINYGSEYCSLSETTSGTTGVVVTDTDHYLPSDCVFEFDFMQVDGARNYAMIYIRNKANSSSVSIVPHLYDSGKQINTWIHYKCEISGNKLYVYVDDATTPIERTLSSTDTNYRLYWSTSNTNTELRFKNFKCYSG